MVEQDERVLGNALVGVEPVGTNTYIKYKVTEGELVLDISGDINRAPSTDRTGMVAFGIHFIKEVVECRTIAKQRMLLAIVVKAIVKHVKLTVTCQLVGGEHAQIKPSIHHALMHHAKRIIVINGIVVEIV